MGKNEFSDKLKVPKSDISKETRKKLNGFEIVSSQDPLLIRKPNIEKSGASATTGTGYVKTGETMSDYLSPTGTISTSAAVLANIAHITLPVPLWQPFKDKEIDTVNRISDKAWQDAIKMFPDLTKAGLSPGRIKKIGQALLANELYFYNLVDRIDDVSVKKTGSPVSELFTRRDAKDVTLGYSQISENGVIKDRQEFPRFKEFLDQNGYKPGDEGKVLLNLNLAPAMILANLAHNVKIYERHNIPMNEVNLMYGYDPDVNFAKSDTKYEHPLTNGEAKILTDQGQNCAKAIPPKPSMITPAIINKSPHVHDVLYWLNKLNTTDK